MLTITHQAGSSDFISSVLQCVSTVVLPSDPLSSMSRSIQPNKTKAQTHKSWAIPYLFEDKVYRRIIVFNPNLPPLLQQTSR